MMGRVLPNLQHAIVGPHSDVPTIIFMKNWVFYIQKVVQRYLKPTQLWTSLVLEDIGQFFL